MAGISGFGSNNLNNLRLNQLKNLNKNTKPEETKQEDQKEDVQAPKAETLNAGKFAKVGDINTLLINKGIKINKPDDSGQQRIETKTVRNGANKIVALDWLMDNPGDLVTWMEGDKKMCARIVYQQDGSKLRVIEPYTEELGRLFT